MIEVLANLISEAEQAEQQKQDHQQEGNVTAGIGESGKDDGGDWGACWEDWESWDLENYSGDELGQKNTQHNTQHQCEDDGDAEHHGPEGTTGMTQEFEIMNMNVDGPTIGEATGLSQNMINLDLGWKWWRR